MKKIILLSPLEDFLINPKEFPPLGVLYLSSYLKHQGHEVDVIHGNFENIRKEYDFYGISASTPQYPKAREILHKIKGTDKSSRVILGGPHTIAPNTAKEALEDGFSQVVIGQGEKALASIIQGDKRKIIRGESLSQQELDILLPDRSAIDFHSYGYPFLDGKKATTIMTSRGCPYRCSFCSISCGKVIFRSAEKVVEEISMLKDYGYERFLFLDDSFTIHKKRLKEILLGVGELNIKYRCYARPDNSNNSALLESLFKSGCAELGAGVESGSQQILDLVNKKTQVEDNINFINLSQKIGISVNSFIMTGLPSESRETIKETRDFMEKAMPKTFGYNIFTPMPDSPIAVDYEKPFPSGKYAGRSFKDFITLYHMPYEKAVTKSKKITECFVSTPSLSREDILNSYYEEFETMVSITGFDPRKRGGRKAQE